MPPTRRFEVVVAGDDKDVQKMFDRVGKGAGGMGGKIDNVGKKVGTAIAAGFATDQLVNFGTQLFNTASQLTAIDTKVKTVFESQAADIRKWADSNNEAFGLSDDQLAGLAANFGDLLKPMGFTADQAAAMSKDVVGLSGALSAWSGGTIDTAGAADKLAAAMLGEREGLKELGIAISQAEVDARVAAKGQDKLTGAALQQAEAVATQELIFEKSQDAQKAWANGSNDALKAQNKLKAATQEMKEKLATALVPAMLKAFEVGEKLVAGGAKIVGFLMDNKKAVLAVGIGIAAVLLPAALALIPAFIAWSLSAAAAAASTLIAIGPVVLIGAAIAGLAFLVITHFDTIKNVISGVFDWVKGNWPLLLAILTGPFGLAVLAITRNWDTIKAGAAAAVNWVKDRFNDVVSFITGLPGRISAAARGMWDGIAAAFKSAINTIIRGWNRIEFKIPGFKVGPVGFGGFTLGVPDIPQLAHGGIVTGPTLALLGDNPSGREAVIPLDRAGGLGSTTIVVQNSGVIGSQGELERWLFAALESATRKGVLPGQSTRKAFAR